MSRRLPSSSAADCAAHTTAAGDIQWFGKWPIRRGGHYADRLSAIGSLGFLNFLSNLPLYRHSGNDGPVTITDSLGRVRVFA
jgi:hypothetical protein